MMVSRMLGFFVRIFWQEHLGSLALILLLFFLPVLILFYLLCVAINSLAVGNNPGTVSIENQLLPTGMLISE